MEDDIEPSTSSILPIALAILAILLGAAGLYFGLTASQRLTEVADQLKTGDSVVAKAEKQLAAYDTKITELEASYETQRKTVERLRIYVAQSEKLVKALNSTVKENREQIVQNGTGLSKLASAAIVRAPENTNSTTANQGGPAPKAKITYSEAAAPGEPDTYTIKSGDTLASIASKRGVNLQALLDANPEADPRRLRIGQIITIPTE